VVAGSALFLLSPLILVVAFVVRRSIGSPVLFRQQRPGLHGVPFTIYKFRTMSDVRRDADGRTIPDDLRTPPVGRFLRSSSLDELPELWNVLRGEMSMVGPRPLLMAYLARYTPTQMRRHEVRPGVTGLAQVSGRNAMTWEQKFALDIRYVDEHDLRLDLEILVRTAHIVLARDGVRHSDGGQGDMPEFMGSDAGVSGGERDDNVA
jgi:lipopolysaccharide/colanic/teichoic acid biosynthesis glycosyltransferase